MEESNYDFSGWATKNNLKCSDGRTIRNGAFKDQDGKIVPLVYNHDHSNPENILGHALLENKDEGVYCYGLFNDTTKGQLVKTLVKHGDIESLSIYANQLKQVASDVVHGLIREVSLVQAGANPGAMIDTVISHSDTCDEEAIIFSGEEINLLSHSEDEKFKKKEGKIKMEEPKKEVSNQSDDEKTIADVFDTLTEEQKTAVYAMIGQILEDNETDLEGGEEMKHNVFDTDTQNDENVISHSDQENIMAMAKSSQFGTFQTALQAYIDENALQHDATSGGFSPTGDGNVTWLYPEYKDVRPGEPELITNDQGWVTNMLAKVHKSPISRIRTSQVDIRNIDSIKAKGYVKGKNKKQSGNFNLVRRTTDPQTVYVHNALHRDDVVDITDFDYAGYLYQIDRLLLNEELAIAMLLGDGREAGSEEKIAEDKIRPIWLDDDLYTIHVDVDINAAKTELQGTNTGLNFGENYLYAEAIISTLLYSRENYRGTGTPDFYCDQHILNVMLLARDNNGRRIYNSKAELATALNVGEIYTVEQYAGKTRTTSDNKVKKILGIMVNLQDYSLGATKGGEITHFTDFDIDFNQLKSLLETRTSGALTRVYSAIALEEDVTPDPAG